MRSRRVARAPAGRAHRRLGAGRDEPHLLDRRHGVDDLLGELDLALGRRAERRPVGGRLLHRLDDLGVGVAEDERPPGHHPVDVAAPVGVLDVGALAAPREEGLVRPTASMARTGEFTPPGMSARARRHRLVPHSQPASSFAQYETITSAPARLIAVRLSIAAARSSSQPRAAAAFTIAYSPLTL